MFICRECHEKEGCRALHLFMSNGVCEICGKTETCYDCKNYKIEKLIMLNEELISKYPDDNALKLNLKSLKERENRGYLWK